MKQIIKKDLVLLKDLGMKYPVNSSLRKYRYGIYECFCGNIFESQTHNVNKGNVKSCGCLKNITTGVSHLNRTSKGFSTHEIYNTWNTMFHRCYNENRKDYKYYGKIGTRVCKEWLDIKNFINDMYPTFKEGLTLDRIDVNGNYEPSNCRWVDNFVQARNKRRLQKNNTSGYRGVSFDKYANKWSVIIGVDKKKIKIGYFKTAEEGARDYDKYVIDNNLEHLTNF